MAQDLVDTLDAQQIDKANIYRHSGAVVKR